MHRRTVLLSSVGTLTLAGGCLGGDAEEEPEEAHDDLPEDAAVEITGEGFDPLVSQIAPGGTVTWENTADEPYRVDAYQFHGDSAPWSFRETVEPGETTSHTFDDPGQYDFYDANHGQFNSCGRIRVGRVEESGSLPCR